MIAEGLTRRSGARVVRTVGLVKTEAVREGDWGCWNFVGEVGDIGDMGDMGDIGGARAERISSFSQPTALPLSFS